MAAAFFFLSNFIFSLHLYLEVIKLTCDHPSAWCFQQQFGPQVANIDQSTLKHKRTVSCFQHRFLCASHQNNTVQLTNSSVVSFLTVCTCLGSTNRIKTTGLIFFQFKNRTKLQFPSEALFSCTVFKDLRFKLIFYLQQLVKVLTHHRLCLLEFLLEVLHFGHLNIIKV